MQQEIVIMAVICKGRGVMQRSTSVEIDRVGGLWKPSRQVPESGIKYSIYRDMDRENAGL